MQIVRLNCAFSRNLVLLICKDEFAQNGILLRGAIAKGEFDEMPAREMKNLRKELIVGQAYVDAYLLENSVKTIGINLSKDVYDDLQTAKSSSCSRQSNMRNPRCVPKWNMCFA